MSYKPKRSRKFSYIRARLSKNGKRIIFSGKSKTLKGAMKHGDPYIFKPSTIFYKEGTLEP